jgi:secreted trypsin-like serine protease
VNKRKLLLVVVIVLGLTLASLSAAYAIVFGWPDGDDHPYVGIMVADDAEGPAWRCSGTLISPTVFLTAGHCAFEAEAARVWFDTDLTDNDEYPFGGETSIEGTAYSHPNFDGTLALPNTSDVGVVILSEPVDMDTYGVLPEIGLADQLNTAPGSQAMLNIVGYGRQLVKPEYIAELVRHQATPMLVELGGAMAGGYNIHLSSNPGKGGGTGGSCFGDSGGPALEAEGSNVVVGVGSFGLNANCRGAGYYYRVDTEYAQEFINDFLEP